MEEITKILKMNNLYDETLPTTRLNNKEEEFLKTYKYNETKKHFFPKNIKRDNKGNILLDEIPYIVSNIDTYGDNNPFWILLNNGSKILLKNVSQENIELELLIMYFLKELDMSCAKYDKVLLNDKTYLSSNSFLRNNEKIELILPSSGYDINTNLQEVKKYNADIFYLKTIFIDRLYGNTDRYANFGIITGNHIHKKLAQPRIAPLFDNADKCLIKENKHIQLFPGINGNDQLNVVINYLLKYDFINDFIKNKLKGVNLEKCALLLEKEKQITVSNNTYNNIESFFKDSEQQVNEALKDNGKSFKIKLT